MPTSRRSGQTRRTEARRTQGSCSGAARTSEGRRRRSCRAMRPRAACSISARVVCARADCATLDLAHREERRALQPARCDRARTRKHRDADQRCRRPRLSRRGLSHMRHPPRILHAQVLVQMPTARAAIGTSEWPVMPGEVFTSRRNGLPRLSSIVDAAPAAAAERAERASAQAPAARAPSSPAARSGRGTCVSSVKYLFW